MRGCTTVGAQHRRRGGTALTPRASGPSRCQRRQGTARVAPAAEVPAAARTPADPLSSVCAGAGTSRPPETHERGSVPVAAIREAGRSPTGAVAKARVRPSLRWQAPPALGLLAAAIGEKKRIRMGARVKVCCPPFYICPGVNVSRPS
jgi:hypothetical protein